MLPPTVRVPRVQLDVLADIAKFRADDQTLDLEYLGSLKSLSRAGKQEGGELYMLVDFTEGGEAKRVTVDDRGRIQEGPSIVGALKSRAARLASRVETAQAKEQHGKDDRSQSSKKNVTPSRH